MHLMLIACALVLTGGCRTSHQLAEERAQAERDYLRNLEGQYGDDFFVSFPLTVPGGMVTVKQPVPCPDYDSGSVKIKDGQLAVRAPCPPVTINTDSLFRNNAVYKSALVGRRLADMKRDSVEKELVIARVESKRYKEERNRAYRWIACIIGAGVAYIFISAKFKIVTGFFKRLLS